jgi:hypothetical protein
MVKSANLSQGSCFRTLFLNLKVESAFAKRLIEIEEPE